MDCLAHGREHVNCGQGLDPNSVDNSYPYPTNTIGTWGWDMFGGSLINPSTHTDFMGYCDSQWISDYNYINLFNRGNNVNAANVVDDPDLYVKVSLDGRGLPEYPNAAPDNGIAARLNASVVPALFLTAPAQRDIRPVGRLIDSSGHAKGKIFHRAMYPAPAL